jgi:hypothetical protein
MELVASSRSKASETVAACSVFCIEVFMQFEALYLIEPRPALRDQLRGRVEQQLAELLLEPVVLSNKEGGCHSVWTENDYALTVKLLHLAQVREYTPLSCEENFEAVFGSPRISVELFDHWWTIRRLLRDDDTESLRPLLKEFLPAVDRTGNELVDRWLEWVREQD